MTDKQDLIARALAVYLTLSERYKVLTPHLKAENPWQLLVATMLAAQCTDARVNMVTPGFFARWPDAASVSGAEHTAVEECIRSTGFYKNKAANIIASAQKVISEFGGILPARMSDLLTLPGVARKTANVVLSGAFGINEGIAVDTHVLRITQRLGLSRNSKPEKLEKDLMALLPVETWGKFNHMMVSFGREVCKARKPLCTNCELSNICPSAGGNADN